MSYLLTFNDLWEAHREGDIAVEALLGSYADQRPTGYGRNVAGMRVLMDKCRALGAVYESDPGPWPADPALTDKHLKYAGQQERPGIPLHKLYGTNDDWHILPIEIEGFLHIIDQDGQPIFAEVEVFASWLRDSIEHGGARQS